MRKPFFFTLFAVVVIFLMFLKISRSVGSEYDHGSIIDLIKTHQGVERFSMENLRLEDISTMPIEVEGRELKVSTRSDKMTIQNCTACHQGPLERSGVSFSERKGHWNIISPHGNALNMSCITCHNFQDVGRLNAKPVFDGISTVGYNESFRLCAVCHSKEFKDWSGGAHGKRLIGWAGEKVIKNCTECHNPHSPKFPVRRPTVMSPVPPVVK